MGGERICEAETESEEIRVFDWHDDDNDEEKRRKKGKIEKLGKMK